MAKTTRKAGKRTTTGRDGSRARKSGVSEAGKPGLRKPKPAKTDARKQKPTLRSETARLKRQLKAGWMQQEATAEILRAVANASGDAAGPLQLIAETTAGLFKASSVSIQLAEGSEFTQEYRVGAIAKRIGAAYPRSNIKVGGRNLPGTVVAENRQIHIPDLDHLDPSMSDFPGLPHARAGGARSVCGTPLRREHKAIGALIVFRDRLLPFTGDELALLQSFADQAVIAIQNARLFNETEEALERQTATSEILRIISQSPTDVQPVFDAIVQTAVRLIRCDIAFVLRCEGATFSPAAAAGPDGPLTDLGPTNLPVDPSINFPSRAIVGKKNVHLPDWSMIELPEHERQMQALIGVNSALFLPLLREAECIGVLALAGKRANIFGESELALAESFRDQALIAIENTRLFNETKEALGRQTATADILRIISRSVAHAAPVFDTILESCQRLFDPYDAAVYLVEGDRVRGVARRGPGVGDWGTDSMPLAGSSTGLAIAQRRPLHFPDLADKADLPEDKRDAVRLAGGMSVLYAPIISESRGVGSLVVTRQPRKPFTDSEIEFIQSFADQAAIAIENARLFNETKEALERQTATADILKVIAGSPSDVQPVFEAIAERSNRLVGGLSSAVYAIVEDVMHLMAFTRTSPEADAAIQVSFPRPLTEAPWADRVRKGEIVEIPDAEIEWADHPALLRMVRLRGFRCQLLVPLLRDGATIGLISVTRKQSGTFAPHHVQLLQSFADQAVIAIENVRLFEEVQNKTRSLTESLQQQTATADVLKVISRSAFDLDAVMHTLARSAAELCAAGLCGLYIREGDFLVCRGYTTISKEQEDFVRQARIPANDPDFATTRALSSGEIANIGDFKNDRSVATQAFQEKLGFKSLLIVPLMREGQGVGLFVLGRDRVGQFSPRHVELVQTFADQAVIAIENARLFNEVQAKTRELVARNSAYSEQIEHQSATIEILKAMSGSQGDAQPVFDVIVQRAMQICNADIAVVLEFDGELVHLRSISIDDLSTPPEVVESYRRLFPQPPSRASVALRAIFHGQIIHIPDMAEDGDLSQASRDIGRKGALAIPLLRDGRVIGSIGLSAKVTGGFSEAQIELLKTFAEQAVIAIRSAETFRELNTRTRDLSESLQQQTATADVLKVISRSAFDLQAVFDTLAHSAAKLCAARLCGLHLREGDVLVCRGYAGATEEQDEFVRRTLIPVGANFAMSRALSGEIFNIGDFESDPTMSAQARTFQQILGFKALLFVPLMRDGHGIGVFVLGRDRVGKFSRRHVELAQTFADQAVIAIENTRLFNETKEALERQTATAEILKVIASSPDDVQPVFQAIAERSNHLVGGFATTVVSIIDDVVHLSAFTSTTPAADAALGDFYPRPLSGFTYSEAVRRGEVYRIVDAEVELAGQSDELAIVRRRGWRSALWVPLLLEGEAIGVIGVTRVEPGTFADHHVEMLRTFADQAVIAISNVNLFRQVQERTRDLQESLQQQTATADVLKVISRSTFDLQTVLETLIKSAVELSGANRGSIFLREGDVFPLKAASHTTPEFLQYWAANPPRAGRGSATNRVIASGRVEIIPDVLEDPEMQMPAGALVRIRATLGVPMLRDDKVEGVLVLTRPEPGHFSKSQIDLVQTFADQAVIAVENVRLFDETQARTKELAASLDELRTAQDRLVQTEKLASLGQLTAGIAHEIKNPLNFVNNFSALSVELIDEMTDIFENPALDDAGRRKELDEIRELLKSNLEKVVQHGKRADSIVKNMLLHSREGSGEHRAVDINALLDESLNLAYHGARAEKPGFNITLQRDLDPDAGVIELFPQEITRALLNLISNGFYAVSKRKAENGGLDFDPVLSAATKNLGNHIEIRIRDNGTGIPPEVRERMFNPFFTTKPAGEGTGLGLSMTHDIIVKQHGGRIEVDTQPGQFTEFTIVLPRAATLASTEKN